MPNSFQGQLKPWENYYKENLWCSLDKNQPFLPVFLSWSAKILQAGKLWWILLMIGPGNQCMIANYTRWSCDVAPPQNFWVVFLAFPWRVACSETGWLLKNKDFNTLCPWLIAKTHADRVLTVMNVAGKWCKPSMEEKGGGGTKGWKLWRGRGRKGAGSWMSVISCFDSQI